MPPSPQGGAAEDLARLAAEHRRAFRERFPEAPEPVVVFAPGRVNLMGAHLDYNGGPVLPTAIDRGTLVAIAGRAGPGVRFASTLEPGGFEGELGELPRERTGSWADYPLGVVRELAATLAARGEPGRACGFDVLFGGNLPVGAGLSSSASICVGTAYALDRLWGLALERLELVHAALRAERGFVGVQCGIMDPYAVGLARPGHLLWLDCKDASFEHLPLDPERVAVAVADTGVRRELAAGEFNRRVAECEEAFRRLGPHAPEARCLRDVPLEVFEAHAGELPPVVRRRAEHVVREVDRTFRAREALLAGDEEGFGQMMSEAHRSLRELFEVSCPELDRIVEDALEVPGVLGARLTGAGFGGCAVVLCRRGCEDELAARLASGFSAAFGRAPEIAFYGGDAGPRVLEDEARVG